jgi:hypothetical protein
MNSQQQQIFSSPRSRFFIAAKSIFSLPRIRFSHRRGVDFFHRREVDFFIAAISIFLCHTARIDFIRLTAIHASRLYRLLLCLMARIDFICLTAIHASRRYQFFFASRQESVSSA